MPKTDAQKRARDKWDAVNMAHISVKLRKDLAEQFAAACKANGTTRSAVVLQAVREYVATHTTEDNTTT